MSSLSKTLRAPSRFSQSSSSSISRLSTSASSIHDEDPPITKLTKSIIDSKSHKLSFAIAGGGASAISSLASTPGASSVLLNGSVLYDRLSFCQYISQHLGYNVDQSNFDATGKVIANDNFEEKPSSNVYNYRTRGGQFGFASSGAAVLLSKAALHHAFEQSSLGDMSNRTLGIGCTSTLVSHGREGRNSRAHISVVRGDGEGILWNVKLCNEGMIVGDNKLERRDRKEEEDLLAELILSSIRHFDDNTFESSFILDRSGDALDAFDLQRTHHDKDSKMCVQNAAQNVIDESSDTDAIIITQQQNSMAPLEFNIIPPETLIFPGSFNPPHIGHATLAQAAAKTMARKKRQELMEYFSDEIQDGSGHSMMDIMWNTTEYQSFKQSTNDDIIQGKHFPVLFEMSLTNADKPAMPASEASRRVSLFPNLFNGDENQSFCQLQEDWGVILTSAPLFIDKVRVMKKYLAPSSAAFLPNKRQITFIIGTDTMVRIINPKYYGDYDNMLKAVRDMGKEGVHFVVGGRLEQGNDGGGEKFITGEEELVDLPSDVRDLFTIIQEEDFRVDISSTELRKKIDESI